MEQKNLKKKLKEFELNSSSFIEDSEKGKVGFKITRQSIYHYVDLFDSGRESDVPESILRTFYFIVNSKYVSEINLSAFIQGVVFGEKTKAVPLKTEDRIFISSNNIKSFLKDLKLNNYYPDRRRDGTYIFCISMSSNFDVYFFLNSPKAKDAVETVNKFSDCLKLAKECQQSFFQSEKKRREQDRIAGERMMDIIEEEMKDFDSEIDYEEIEKDSDNCEIHTEEMDFDSLKSELSYLLDNAKYKSERDYKNLLEIKKLINEKNKLFEVVYYGNFYAAIKDLKRRDYALCFLDYEYDPMVPESFDEFYFLSESKDGYVLIRDKQEEQIVQKAKFMDRVAMDISRRLPL